MRFVFGAEASSIRQPAVRAHKALPRAEVEALMRKFDFARLRNDDYRHPEGILVEDLHDENVFIDADGEIVLIDPVVYLEKAKRMPQSTSSS